MKQETILGGKITTINNELRVFMIVKQGWGNKQYFCNMEQIEECVKDLQEHDDYKVYEFWNNKQTSISRKKLKDILTANQIDSSFIK
jgi:hypothetical protein